MSRFLLVFGLLVTMVTSGFAENKVPEVAGFSAEKAMRLGERMYRDGLLPSGEPIQAVVQKDIPIEGTMFSCQSCHLRSGLGSVEGTIITLPTNGAKLFRTLHVGAEIDVTPDRSLLAKPFQGGDIRPAYTEESLAQVLWNGADPKGRELDWTMPRYLLDQEDMDILVYYLKNLSAQYSPGVSEDEIRFATVLTEGVPPEDRDAMLQTLQAIVKDRNSQSRHQEKKARKGPFYKQDQFRAYRRFVLDVWELKGPRDTWRDQLESYYRKGPVFAVLGGIAEGEWAPIHQFCENLQIPSLFPVTEYPLIAENDWYTLYFSKGPYQEGEAAARFLLSNDVLPTEGKIVQVVGPSLSSRKLARGFQETRGKLGLPPAEVIALEDGRTPEPEFWRQLADRSPGTVFLLWMGPEAIEAAKGLAEGGCRALFFSSSLMGEKINSLPQDLREQSFITHPYRLPREEEKYLNVTRSWLKNRNVPITNLRIQSEVYFLGWMLTGAVRMMGDDFYRDYFLDVLDMMRDEHYAIALYPRLSFGPGQRYASKGCYVLQLTQGPRPDLVPVTDWVIH